MIEPNGNAEAIKAVTDRVKACTPTAKPTTSDERLHLQRLAETRRDLARKLGQRYEDCSVSSFVVSDDQSIAQRQEAVREALRVFIGDMAKGQQNTSLILHGPPGTGKDHFLAACIGRAMYVGDEVTHHTGADLFADKEDARREGVPEKELVNNLVRCDVLAISDPVPWGKEALTESQMAFLGRVIDARYRECKPVWLTINVPNYAEMRNRIGSPIADRLRDGALVLECNWPTFRKSERAAVGKIAEARETDATQH